MIIQLENGVTLDDGSVAVCQLKDYADEKGVSDVRIFLTSNKTYLLVIGTTPKYETSLFEHMAAHIDMLSMAQEE